ncbi:MAG TPA: biotin carboxylase N-terminal domain-containing protein, partial [Euzebya sp.]|nr:biotin carboxylase N-terminal domain-containing protein [Euzebya sp.]
LHVTCADIAVPLDGTTASETYLDIARLLAAAERAGADAIHPGYGFLAENATFARAVIAADLTWVGPTPDAIAAMGDKLAAKQQMSGVGVPTLLSVTDRDDADQVGYPLIVKAAAGGGGKGMRVVEDPGDLDAAVAAARREAASAFGDDTVFLERYLQRPRHIEVQVLADSHGTVVHLGERECSLQRRHQKVIEEAPSPAVDDTTRARLGHAAVTAAQAIGYQGAGTVEFVATGQAEDLEFYFLEVNTRLQVEHPVTELAWRVAGDEAPLDLVALQLRIAEGAPLPFGQDDLRLVGHAVEARLYAEDPAAGFLPATGTVELLQPAGLPGTRWDTGVVSGDVISPWFDPLLAKVIAAAPTRSQAVRLLARELHGTRLHGLPTNRDALVAMLTHDRFLAGDLHTRFIADHLSADDLAPAPAPQCLRAHVLAVALVAQHARRTDAAVQPTIPSGWRNNRTQLQQATFTAGGLVVEVGYGAPGWDRPWQVTVDGADVDVAVIAVHDDEADLVVDGLRLTVLATRLGEDPAGVRWAVDSPLGATTLLQQPRFGARHTEELAGSLVAPMPGTVQRVCAAVGDVVAQGDLLLVLEAMKMEHRVTAPTAGTITALDVGAGDQIESGTVLAVIDEDGTQTT